MAGMARIVIKYVTVLVPSLSFAAGRIEVTVAMGVHGVTSTEQAGECAGDGWVVKDLLYLRNSGQDVIAYVTFLFENLFKRVVDVLVDRLGKIGF